MYSHFSYAARVLSSHINLQSMILIPPPILLEQVHISPLCYLITKRFSDATVRLSSGGTRRRFGIV